MLRFLSATTAICLCGAWIFGAVVEWHFDPGHWSAGTRLGCMMGAFITSPLIFISVVAVDDCRD